MANKRPEFTKHELETISMLVEKAHSDIKISKEFADHPTLSHVLMVLTQLQKKSKRMLKYASD